MTSDSENRMQEKQGGRDRESYFKAWFNNRMTPLLMAVQCPKALSRETLMRIRFFLEDVEHHYLPAGSPESLYSAFRYLETYFLIYPEISRDESRAAVEMVARIYACLGIESNSLARIRQHLDAGYAGIPNFAACIQKGGS